MGVQSILTTSIGIIEPQNAGTATADNLLFIAVPIIAAVLAVIISTFACKKIHSNFNTNVIAMGKISLISIVSVLVASLYIMLVLGIAEPANADDGKIVINDHIDLIVDEDTDIASVEAKITNGTKEIYSLDTLRLTSNNESLNDDLWSIVIIGQDYKIYDGTANSQNNIAYILQPNQTATIQINLQLDNADQNIYTGDVATLEIATKPTKYTAYYTKNNEVKSSNINFNFDFAEFENANNTVVNRKLATVASLLDTKMYADEQIIVGSQKYDMGNKIALEKALGFEDNYYYSMWNNKEQADTGVSIVKPDLSSEKNDTTSYEFAHKKIYFGDHYSEIVSVNIAGTQCSEEWVSNLDFGANTKNYFDATGNHPLWKDLHNHKGFDIAAKRVEYALNDYLNKYVQNDKNTKRILFISGHSRGAGVANIVGKDYEDKATAKTFTYTFAAPNTTDEVSSKLNYSTIFNIMNMDDIVCQIPCKNMGYDKYGRDITLSISTGESISGDDLSDTYSSIMKGDEYGGNDPDEIANLVKALRENINKGTREQTFQIKTDSTIWDYCFHGDDDAEYTSAEADAEIAKINTEFKTYGLELYSIVEKQQLEGSEKYKIVRWYNPAFILQDISNIILKKKDVPYNYSNNVWNTIEQVIPIVFGVYDGHIPMSYVVLATNAVY